MPPAKDLQSQWTQLYSMTLPSLARAHDPAQVKWPVTLDHCFARIILDNTIGEGQEQWDKRLKRPAVRNMSDEQLLEAIALGGKIRTGEVDLVALDMQSLETRGNGERKYGAKGPAKRMAVNECSLSSLFGEKRNAYDTGRTVNDSRPNEKRRRTTPLKPENRQSTISFKTDVPKTQLPSPAPIGKQTDYSSILDKIENHSSLTSHRRSLYTALLSVPSGHYTTYAALSDYLNSSARAVGSGMRHNPFAPEVPCHRVLAADGSIGGFHGDWGKDGKYAREKIALLRSEGVYFDSKGKVVGQPFRYFKDLRKVG